MNPVFGDTAYWIGLTSPADVQHRAAVALAQSIGSRLIVTSQVVLTELLDGAAERGSAVRNGAVRFVRLLDTLPNVRVIPQTPELFAAALALYEQRPDKAWNLTDCASLVICQQEGVYDVLTHDYHFAQMGLNSMLRSPAP